ncbi:MAG: ImmA/IrrE family metallo-endopeptidase [Halanaerobiales bacterium]|nr:ImmA/IrrE family metallo-endopeptidase [Halanaerobiales bacterium]
MELLNNIFKKTRPQSYEEVKKEVLYFQKEYTGARDNVLQDDIFRIIEERSDVDLILFPIEDDELCGFICEYKGQVFIYINSYLPYEKQIFAVAHEVYHLVADTHRELLHLKNLEDGNDQFNIEERKANLFAALLLVPDESLKKELSLLKVKNSSDLDELKFIKLMDTFAVPYKTIVLRLYEMEIINERDTEKWISIPDREIDQGILYQIKKHKIGDRWQKRTRQVKFSNLYALIIDNDDLELLPKKRIIKDFSFLKQENEDA